MFWAGMSGSGILLAVLGSLFVMHWGQQVATLALRIKQLLLPFGARGLLW
jgi:hypothetical protein